MDKITLVQNLMYIGRYGSIAEENINYRYIKNCDYVNRQIPEFWTEICNSLCIADQVNLFRGLVIAEREFGWMGGSVAGAIWVFKEITPRIPESEYDRLLDWALSARGRNVYVPLGSMTGARNLEEYRFEQECRSQRGRTHEATMARERLASAERHARKASAAQHHQDESNRRRRERQVVVSELSAMSAEKRFEWLAQDTKWAFPAVPAVLFPVDPLLLQNIDPQTLDAVRFKLNARRGHWGRLATAIDQILQ